MSEQRAAIGQQQAAKTEAATAIEAALSRQRRRNAKKNLEKMVVSFKVYVEQGKIGKLGRRLSHVERGCYYTVWIFRDRSLMVEAFDEHRKLTGERRGEPFEAICSSYIREKVSSSGRAQRMRDAGMVMFHTGAIGAGIVAHALTHAALHWLGGQGRERKGQVFTTAQREERLCWLVGELVRQFWFRYYRLQPKVRWLRGETN